MRKSLFVNVAATAILALGLGAANCDPDPVPPDVQTKSSRERLLNAYVSWFDSCSPDQFGFLIQVEPNYFEILSGSNIRDLFASFYDTNIANPNIQLDAARQEACIAWLESDSSCDSDAGEDCEKMFVGTLDIDAACASESECVPGAYCKGLDDENCGQCQARAGLNQSCSETNCAEGLHCNESAQCVAPAQLGESCVQDQDCLSPLECTYVDDQRQCSVVPEFALGDSCEVGGDGCGSWTNSGLYCKDDDGDGTGLCTQISIAEEGETCEMTQSGEYSIVCRNGLMTTHYCDADIQNGQYTGVCRQRPSVGEACTEVFGYCNALESYCDADTHQCLAVTAVGGTCDPQAQDSCDIRSTCKDNGVCESLMSSGNEAPVCQ